MNTGTKGSSHHTAGPGTKGSKHTKGGTDHEYPKPPLAKNANYNYNYPDEHEVLLGAHHLHAFDNDMQPGSWYIIYLFKIKTLLKLFNNEFYRIIFQFV